MRVLVCGGRSYDDETNLRSVLDKYHLQRKFELLIHGRALGADSLADTWARIRGIQRLSFPALWKEYGDAAGPIRNTQMLIEGKPDLVIAFPGGKGTRDMIRQTSDAIKRGMKIHIVMV